jgi:hypothetical protein
VWPCFGIFNIDSSFRFVESTHDVMEKESLGRFNFSNHVAFGAAVLFRGSRGQFNPILLEHIDMKPIKFAAISAVALVFGYAQAQDATVAPQPSPVSQESATLSVGGVSDASRSDAGSPIEKTRQQVYQEYLRARQSGEMDRIQSTYGGQ